MSDLYLYSTPHYAIVTLTLDSGVVVNGVPCAANGREDAHRLTLVPDTPTQGAVVHVWCDGFITQQGRGIVEVADVARFIHDDFRLEPVPPPPPAPAPPNPHVDAQATCQAVYEQGDFDLGTKQGCGEYVEACVEALHAQQSQWWGHIRKQPAQNQWQGHAIDALMLASKAGGTDAGIYDIVWSTESPEAAPAWSYKGGPDLPLWYYGPMPCPPP